MKKIFTKINVAKYAMAGLLLVGGNLTAQASELGVSAAAAAEDVEVTAVTPDPSASVETPLDNLKEITITFNSDISIVSSNKVAVTKDGDKVADGSLYFQGKELNIVFNAALSEYGLYQVVIPAGYVITAAGKNAEITLDYHVGAFEVATVAPSTEEVVEKLNEVTVFMSAPVGGIQTGAKAKVLKDGDEVATATIDWATEPGGNDILLAFDTTLEEYGKYTVVIPQGVLFDRYYTEIDPVMSGSKANSTIELTYNVGLFDVATVAPSIEEVAKSLNEVTVFMTAPVGGFLDGAKLNVKKDGDVVATATLDWATEPYGNDVLVSFDTTLEEYGKYTIEVPEGVIFDRYYDEVDPFFSGARSNTAFELTYNVGLFDVATVAPSIEEVAKSLKEVTVFMTAPVGGFLDGAKLNVKKDGDVVATATLDWATEPYGNDVLVTFDTTLEEYGKYTIEVPEGVIFDRYYDEVDPIFSGARSNTAFELTYNVGLFEVATVAPSIEEVAKSLNEVTVFMTAPVGGFLDGAKLNVKKDGDVVATATLDWATEPYGNDVLVSFDTTLEEYGKYTIEVPEGVIFDRYYDEVDPIFSGARTNTAFELTYNVGLFEVATVAPSIEEVAKSLNEVTVFMTAPVGGFLDGAKLNVKKDGDVVATATLDWATEPYGNDVLVSFDTTLEEYGKYTIEVPEGVIFDRYYDEVDPFFSGARSNTAFELTYNVGLFDVATVAPSIEEVAKSLKEVTVFMTAPVGGFLDGAKLNVKKDGDVVATATLDWATEPYGNDVLVTFDTTLEEYGKYTIEVPEGVIFDRYYDEVDPFFSGARSNTAFELTYNVGLFELAAVTPENGSTVNKLDEVTVFMTAPVGGFLDGAKLSVKKDDVEVATATLDWATEPYGNDVVVLLSEAITESGVYTIEIPAGVIFDRYFDEVDPFFTGARSNETIVLTFTVDTTTGISNVTVNGKNTEAIYTLGGMKVNRLVKGINIINGKKVLVK